MNGKATKKPVEIDWFEWNNNIDELINWENPEAKAHKVYDYISENFIHDGKNKTLKVKTLEGNSYDVPDGYIIIRGVEGEYYPCEPGIFNKTYNKL